ncbi:hypothetical protein C8R46DRAFT_1113577 [Mycena filopes]|nr:hypothetical protein C8R46DRAFT_1113577 [Mycena filopes]
MSLESQARQRIEQCKGNIAHIDSQIRDLVRLRERDRATITTLQVVLSPIHRVPCELLVEIFQVYLAVKPCLYWHVEVELKALLRLTQVCPYWRKVAHTTPQLWVQQRFPILFPVPTVDGRTWTFSRETTKIFLERSASMPISVNLSPSAGFELQPCMEDLLGAVDRWRTLEVSLPSLAALGQIPAGSLKALETHLETPFGHIERGPQR